MRHRSLSMTSLASRSSPPWFLAAGCSAATAPPAQRPGRSRSSSPRPVTPRPRPSGGRRRRGRRSRATRRPSRAAQDMAQQLGQAFAANNPPDVFYVDAARFADYASVGALYAVRDKAARTSTTSTRRSGSRSPTRAQLYCVPKDFSTLAMEINTDLWAKAGLTTADIPTTWDQLTAVAQKLKAKAGITPLVIEHRTTGSAPSWSRPAAGSRQRRHQATADTPANVAGLTYVKTLLQKRAGAVPEAARRRLGRRGVRQGQGRDDDRGQLDRGRHAERLPEHQVHGRRRCRPARRARARSRSPSAGASRRRASTRRRPSSSSRR